MWNCSFRNSVDPRVAVADRRFAEHVYARYYSNLSKFEGKTLDSEADGRRERGNSLSGPGSNAEETVGVRTALPTLLALLGVRSILDVPCGDFNYMRAVLSAPPTPPGVAYTGMDIVSPLVEQLQATFGTGHSARIGQRGGRNSSGLGSSKRHRITFARFDLSLEYLWPADLVVLRDVLFHFDQPRALTVLRRVGLSGCKHALITTFPRGLNRVSARKYHAGRGFSSYASWNLEDEPFALPAPLLALGQDGSRPDRVMGLWPCASLAGRGRGPA